jgi:hypothetical protein
VQSLYELIFPSLQSISFRALVQPRVTRAAIRIANHFAPCVNQEHFNFALFTLHTSKYWSGKLDSNQQPLDPQPSAPPLSYSPKIYGRLVQPSGIGWAGCDCGLTPPCGDASYNGLRELIPTALSCRSTSDCQALQLALCAGLVPRGTKTIFARYT